MNRRSKAFKRNATWCAAVACAVSVAAEAQEAPRAAAAPAVPASAAKAEARPTELEPVIITSERRNENAQATPIAVNALTGNDLRKNNIQQVDDLQRVAPSLSVSDNGVTKYVNIRGIGLGISAPNVSNGVAYLLDGLFEPNAPLFQDDPYFDIQQIEVLRGPQGTLVGQSSTGGAISVVSRLPVLGLKGGDIEQTIGSYKNFRTRGAINLPISDDWAGRFAFQTETKGSFYSTESAPGATVPLLGKPGNLDRQAFRATLLGQPTENLEIILRTSYSKKHSDGNPGKPIPGDPVDAPYVPAAPASHFTLNFDFPTRYDVESAQVSAEVKWQVANEVSLRSITGLQYGNVRFAADRDGSGLPALTGTTNVHERDYSQEFNLLSTGTGKFQWVTGFFELFQDTHGEVVNTVVSPPTTINAHGLSGNNSLGVFGQTTYDFTDRFQVLTGLRYSVDRKADSAGGYTSVNGHLNPSTGDSVSRALTGKVALNYKFTPDHFGYVFAARGYKAGGFNSANDKFNPEYVIDFEGGLKSSFLGGKVNTQLSVYRNRYSNIQVEVYDPLLAFSGVANGTSAIVQGFEAQAQGHFGAWRFDGSASFNKTKLDSVTLIDPRLLPFGGSVPLGIPCQGGGPPGCIDYTPYVVNLQGRELSGAPRRTFSAGVDYRIPLGQGSLTPRFTVAYIGSQYASLFNDAPTDLIRSRTIFNTQWLYQPKPQWRVEAYVNNMFNKFYVSGKFLDLEYYGAPREFGVRVGYDF